MNAFFSNRRSFANATLFILLAGLFALALFSLQSEIVLADGGKIPSGVNDQSGSLLPSEGGFEVSAADEGATPDIAGDSNNRAVYLIGGLILVGAIAIGTYMVFKREPVEGGQKEHLKQKIKKDSKNKRDLL